MRNFIIWLAKVFDVNLTKEVVITKDRYQLENEMFGDIYIDGNLVVNGNITVTGEITCYKIK